MPRPAPGTWRASHPRATRALPHVLGLAWVAVAGVAVLVPALVHGVSLGPFDQLSQYGLSRRPGVVVHYTGPGDQIEMLIPWTTLAWTQVHHGHLPLWNPYSGLGMPLAFNWQSATFSLPALVGYALPVRLAFSAAQITTVLVAGSGTYVFGRVLRLGGLGSVTAATVFELSGPFVGWLGWPNASAMSWAGWIFAATVLVMRGRHRALAVTLFAVSVAFALYAGQPETVVLFALALVVFVAVFLALRARWATAPVRTARPLVDLALAAAAGGALAAPLALPGLQLASKSIVRVVSSYGALAPHNLRLLLFQGFDGLPVAGNTWFGDSIYPETAVYIGVIAAVLVVVALAARHGRPEVPALGVTALAMALIAYAAPVVSAINSVTGLHSVAWHRSIQPMAFALAVLAGVGIDAVVRSGAERRVRAAAAAGFGALGLIVLALWLFGRGTLPHAEASIRARSFVWPVIELGVGLAVCAVLFVAGGGAHRAPSGRHVRAAAAEGDEGGHRARWWAGAALLVTETAFLVAAGAPLASSSPTFITPTPAEVALQRTVGTALVAFGARDCHVPPTLGMHQDINVVYGVRELADWDPMVPVDTFRSLAAATGTHASAIGAPLILCPALSSATTARQYGVGYILEQPGATPPAGTTPVATLAGEGLYRVPESGLVTLAPAPTVDHTSTSTPADDSGVPQATTSPDPNIVRVDVHAASASVMDIHVTDVPGWHGTIDGRPLRLTPLAGTMLQARIPAGHHTVELRYWPTAFTAGLIVGLVAVLALAAAVALEGMRRRRPPVLGRR